jgi:hypothetical protein
MGELFEDCAVLKKGRRRRVRSIARTFINWPPQSLEYTTGDV